MEERSIAAKAAAATTINRPFRASHLAEAEAASLLSGGSAHHHHHGGNPLAHFLDHKAGAQPSAGSNEVESVSPVGSLSLLKSESLAGGQLDLVNWEKDRLLRIWTPPGGGACKRGSSHISCITVKVLSERGDIH